jgi:hypothetical protein
MPVESVASSNGGVSTKKNGLITVDKINDTEYYWLHPLTQEIFTSFDAFHERQMHYNLRVWSCRITGRSSLTYEEALKSEEDFISLLSKFPLHHLKILVRQVHGENALLDVLSTKICKLLQSIHFPNEYVRWKGKTVKIVRAIEKTEESQQCYEVEWEDKKKQTNSETVPSSQMIRTDFPITIHNVRCKIREIARRAKGKTGCWFVDAIVIERLGLTDELSCIVKDGDAPHQSNGEKRKADSDEQQRSSTKRRKLNGNVTEQERRKEKKRKKLEAEYREYLQTLLPYDDLKLLYFEGRTTPLPPPPSSFDSPVVEVSEKWSKKKKIHLLIFLIGFPS